MCAWNVLYQSLINYWKRDLDALSIALYYAIQIVYVHILNLTNVFDFYTRADRKSIRIPFSHHFTQSLISRHFNAMIHFNMHHFTDELYIRNLTRTKFHSLNDSKSYFLSTLLRHPNKHIFIRFSIKYLIFAKTRKFSNFPQWKQNFIFLPHFFFKI